MLGMWSALSRGVAYQDPQMSHNLIFICGGTFEGHECQEKIQNINHLTERNTNTITSVIPIVC